MIDRLLISRLEINPEEMTDDLEYMPVLASLPPKQTVFEYLVGCWKRLNSAKTVLVKKVRQSTSRSCSHGLICLRDTSQQKHKLQLTN